MAMKNVPATQYDAETMRAIAEQAGGIVENLQKAAQDALALMESLQNYDALPLEERWVKTWGETVSKAEASRIMNIGRAKMQMLVDSGDLAVDPGGRVLVRHMCAWANSGEMSEKKDHARRMRSAQGLPKNKRFIP